VRRHVTQSLGFKAKSTVGALSPCGTGQSGATPDSPVPSNFTVLTSATALFTSSGTFAVDHCAQIAVACWLTGQSGDTPDSLLNYSGARWRKPESGWFNPVRAWCTGHCSVAHRTVRCARPQHTQFFAPVQFTP
jgi:hypothetical protein